MAFSHRAYVGTPVPGRTQPCCIVKSSIVYATLRQFMYTFVHVAVAANTFLSNPESVNVNAYDSLFFHSLEHENG